MRKRWLWLKPRADFVTLEQSMRTLILLWLGGSWASVLKSTFDDGGTLEADEDQGQDDEKEMDDNYEKLMNKVDKMVPKHHAPSDDDEDSREDDDDSSFLQIGFVEEGAPDSFADLDAKLKALEE